MSLQDKQRAVIRGRYAPSPTGIDLLSSTARQILLFEALNFPIPDFIHVPLMLDEHGQRMAKRQQSTTLLKDAEHMPEEVIGQLAKSCGLIDQHIPISPNALVQQCASWTYDIMRTKINHKDNL
jgi:glutamyl-tRNA synthetase